MKKFLTIALAGIVLFSFAAGAGAQGVEIGTKLGYASLSGDPGDAFDGAFAGGLYLNYDFNPNVSIQGAWMYHKHSQSDDLASLADFVATVGLGVPASTDIRLIMNQFDVNGIYKFPMEKTTPYLLAGLGFNRWTLDGKVIVGDFASSTDESFWDWEANFGGGLNFMVTEQVKIGGEFVYTYVFDEFDNGTYSFLGTVSYGFGGM